MCIIYLTKFVGSSSHLCFLLLRFNTVVKLIIQRLTMFVFFFTVLTFNMVLNTISQNLFLTFTFGFKSIFKLLHGQFMLMQQFGTFILFKILLLFNKFTMSFFLFFNFTVHIQLVLFIFKHFSNLFLFFVHFFLQFSKLSIHFFFHFSLLSFNLFKIFFLLGLNLFSKGLQFSIKIITFLIAVLDKFFIIFKVNFQFLTFFQVSRFLINLLATMNDDNFLVLHFVSFTFFSICFIFNLVFQDGFFSS
mmetsp:Transcript_1734/g.2557  ORF Transcript_1734/g.2557 Transcript_1734/m.2557 type:complete len:247 (-) Transcript_1734:7811-8551(-)